MYVELCHYTTYKGGCDIFGYRSHFDEFSNIFDHPLLNDMDAFLFSTTFKGVFKTILFSVKTLSVSVWTEGLSAAKCMRSQTKRTIVDRAKK